MEITDFPLINACLNALSGILLLAGYVAIRKGNKEVHARLMISAFAVSTIFLGCYLYYHYHFLHKKYEGEGILRTVYFVILISHIILAVAVVPMVLRTIYLAWRQRWEKHRWWGRRTFPVWMYVSVTGVLVYLMLY
jgi:uncharacterized membrane protein YozB (DUF420 family)|tara:strand:- start:256 stop:663 length:408 start_codon:yes stop_codon:yes gene_type:complete